MSAHSLSEISTFAKHMICPAGLEGLGGGQLKKRGTADFLEYPFAESMRKLEESTDPNLLLEQVMSALHHLLDPDKTPVLLLSDGKDSLTLALALSKMNISCITLTLLRKDDEDLKNAVASWSEGMGHRPFFFSVDDIFESYDHHYFLDACRLMPHPVIDQGFLFFLFGLKRFFDGSDLLPDTCQLIDGLGNDEHLGYLPSKQQKNAFSLSKFGFWRLVPSVLPWLRWYMRSPAESHGDLSAMAAFFKFPHALNVNKYFSELRVSDSTEFVDFRAFSRGSFHDHQCMIQKTSVAASAVGSDIIYPWTYPELSHFCFNLPADSKYDFEKGLNKLCLRELLDKELDWKQEKRGVDLFFDVNTNQLLGFLSEFVSKSVATKVMNDGFLPAGVRQRALLELLNLVGFLAAKGFSREQIESLLMGGRL